MKRICAVGHKPWPRLWERMHDRILDATLTRLRIGAFERAHGRFLDRVECIQASL